MQQEMSGRAHPDLRDLLLYAFTGEEEDCKEALDELKEYDQPDKQASLVEYSAEQLRPIIEVRSRFAFTTPSAYRLPASPGADSLKLTRWPYLHMLIAVIVSHFFRYSNH